MKFITLLIMSFSVIGSAAKAEVLFRAAKPTDKRAINLLVRDPGFIEYYSGPRQVDPDDFYLVLKSYRNAGGNFVIADGDSNKMLGVGHISMSKTLEPAHHYEITYAVLPVARGQGIARQSIKKMIEMIRETDSQSIVTARVAGLNKVSQYLLETEGFVSTDDFDRTQFPRRYLHYVYKPTCEKLSGG